MPVSFEFFLSDVQPLVSLIGHGLWCRCTCLFCLLVGGFFVFTLRLFAVFLSFALLIGRRFCCFFTAPLGLFCFFALLRDSACLFFTGFCGLDRRRAWPSAARSASRESKGYGDTCQHPTESDLLNREASSVVWHQD